MDPLLLITDKPAYRVGDTIKLSVKARCGILDPGHLGLRFAMSKDGATWTKVGEHASSLGCPVTGGEVTKEIPETITVTYNMQGNAFIGMVNCLLDFDSCATQEIIASTVFSKVPIQILAPYTPGYGGLTVLTEPAGAAISVDGQYVGNSPVNDVNVLAGTHSVNISLAGFREITEALTVSAGSNTMKTYKLSHNNWIEDYVDYVPFLIGGAGMIVATIIILKARQNKMKRLSGSKNDTGRY